MTTGKVMVITGASSGFGRLTALMAVEKNYRLVLAARRAERLSELATQIELRGGTVISVPCDITSGDDQQRLIDTALREFGQIDVLVNNAGVPLKQDFVSASLDDIRRQWQTNLIGLVELTKRALPALMQTKGVVINIGSVAGHFSVPGWGNYFPTKVAVRSFSMALRRELLPLGVKISLIEPGPFSTEFGANAGDANFGGLPPEMVAARILRMAEQPKREAIVPFWFAPFTLIGSGLANLLPDVLDVGFLLAGRLQGRKQPASGTVSATEQ